MKSISLIDKKSSAQATRHWLDIFARKILLQLLQKIENGHLTLEDKGEIYSFGEAQESATLIAHISVTHPAFYRQVVFGGSIGAGEAYMFKNWWSPDLVQVIRLMAINMPVLQQLDSKWSAAFNIACRIAHRLRPNTIAKARENISAHYDLGNDFFRLFLDSTMLYSAAIYPSESSTLEEASLNKMAHICKRLRLNAHDHLLEIGAGWGGMAIFAAKTTGCRVTSVTISKEQFIYATEWVKREGLEKQVTVLLQDYRLIEGTFDKLVSIEMIEAVGHEFYGEYFSKCSSLLKPDGLMLIQAITIQDQRFEYARKNTDFIQQYIFPGGCLPSNTVVANHITEDTDMQIVGLEDITQDYARTLADWRKAFSQNLDAVKAQGFDEVFMRMWDFYLCYCEGGFTERAISTAQYVFAKPLARALPRVN
ncbi:cyclopropane-fatty-acyl-phospholipid synthase [Cellvibrio zantedeschiae]|uniref:Cyclopropane-fatty-acyl-phospholipid synthase n=1 Tax=Cellvibrio zantedeschiae TaxID=1237077 RepID=A0ABQ3B2G7_9GAMM|nr:cyclopropane-fatty-acyl-phospholipid synthase family protein [Cellvibrio zantedeschiae]GGY75449.1 cyclopropane-fatty-acyl-phospholipid synthase [Cellvibrio zantedeschiae]